MSTALPTLSQLEKRNDNDCQNLFEKLTHNKDVFSGKRRLKGEQ